MDVLAIIGRIEMRLAEIGMSKDEFYEKSKISSASFSQWRNGIYKPSIKKLMSAAKCIDVSVEYLTGERKEKLTVQKDDGLDNKTLELYNLLQELSPENRAKLVELARLYAEDQKRHKLNNQ